MIQEIVPNLYRIPVPLPDNPLRELNAYLIRGADRSLLIDTGFRLPPCRQAVEEGLKEAGVDRARLDILCTHIHTDHTGQCLDLVGPGRTIYIGAGDYPMTIRSYDAYFWAITDRRFAREGFPPTELKVLLGTNPARTLGPDLDRLSCVPLSDGARLTAGDYTLEIIETPGHTPGQICLWLASEGLLFTADHILFDITPNIAMWPNLENALGHYLKSLDRIRDFPVRLALPGHRHSAPLLPRIEALHAHHRFRAGETMTAVSENPGLTAYEIAARLTWDIRARDWDHFPLNQKWFAVGETIAHLEYLMDLGQVARITRRDGMAGYEAAGKAVDLSPAGSSGL